MKKTVLFILLIFLLGACVPSSTSDATSLSLWHNTPRKKRIIEFVRAVTSKNGPDFVPVAERLAVFDFDGTVAPEKPDYMEVMLALWKLCQSAREKTGLLKQKMYRAACDRDLTYIDSIVYRALLTAFLSSPQKDYRQAVLKFTREQTHPRFIRPYKELYYAPMAELINYLRAHDFTVYLVSASEEGFLRAYARAYLGFRPHQAIGSGVVLAYQQQGDKTYKLIRTNSFMTPKPEGAGKAVLIGNRIGLRPIFAFGNSMGDVEMLTYTASSSHRSLQLILIHDDEREYVYRHTNLEELAQKENWVRVSMTRNFKLIFPRADRRP